MSTGRVIHDRSGSVLVGDIEERGVGLWTVGVPCEGGEKQRYYLSGDYGWRAEYDPEPLPTKKNALIEVTVRNTGRITRYVNTFPGEWSPVQSGIGLYVDEYTSRFEKLREQGDVEVRVVFEGEEEWD